MAQTLRVTPVVGLPQFTGWSHVLEHIIDPETRCVFCFSVSGENASNVGREIVESILAIPPRSAQGLYQALEDAQTIATAQNCVLSMVAGVFRYKRSVFAALSGSILLKRDSKVGKIIHAESAIAVIEGKYDLDDVFVFATDQAKQFVPEIELHFKRGFDSDGVITSIVPALHALPDSSLSGLGFVVIVDEEPLAEVAEYSATFEINESPTDETVEQQPFFSVEQETAVDEISNDAVDSDQNAPLGSTQIPNASPQKKPLSALLAGVSKWLPKIKGGLVWLLKIIVQLFMILKSLFSNKTYVGGPSRKKILRWLAVVVVIIICIAGGIWWYSARKAKAEAATEAAVSPFKIELQEIKAQAIENPISAREQASALIVNLQAQQSEAETIGDKRKATAFAQILGEAQSTYQEISGRDEVSELPVFYDLRLVSSDFITSVAGSNQKIAYFIDSEKKQAVALDVTTKQVAKQNLDSIGTVKAVTAGVDESKMFLLANGIFENSLTADAVPVNIKEEGDSNRGATLVGSFGSYVYVFNPEKRNIYRYIKGDDGDQYSDPIGWLLDPLGVPFEDVTSWAIDGEIWMGTKTGSVLRFASGRAEDFNITGLQDPFSSTLHIVTREEKNEVWVLEHQKSRVVVLTKSGEFLREVKSTSLGAATGMILDDTGNKVLIISGSSVFEISL